MGVFTASVLATTGNTEPNVRDESLRVSFGVGAHEPSQLSTLLLYRVDFIVAVSDYSHTFGNLVALSISHVTLLDSPSKGYLDIAGALANASRLKRLEVHQIEFVQRLPQSGSFSTSSYLCELDVSGHISNDSVEFLSRFVPSLEVHLNLSAEIENYRDRTSPRYWERAISSWSTALNGPARVSLRTRKDGSSSVAKPRAYLDLWSSSLKKGDGVPYISFQSDISKYMTYQHLLQHVGTNYRTLHTLELQLVDSYRLSSLPDDDGGALVQLPYLSRVIVADPAEDVRTCDVYGLYQLLCDIFDHSGPLKTLTAPMSVVAALEAVGSTTRDAALPYEQDTSLSLGELVSDVDVMPRSA
ncbi:unnamed protein product [Peniophora sp. CBMAI 1063]|nr:unnamed protein product [Peniophora sp. CBMAI 1063]